MSTPTTMAAYVRVSTEKQAEQWLSFRRKSQGLLRGNPGETRGKSWGKSCLNFPKRFRRGNRRNLDIQRIPNFT